MKGRVIEQGTHEMLLRSGNAYARLVTAKDLETNVCIDEDVNQQRKKDPKPTSSMKKRQSK